MRRVLFNRPVVLEARGSVADGAGGRTGGWAVLGTLWAEIAPRRGRERAADGARLSKTPVDIRVRAGGPERPAAGQRLRSGTRAFRILAVAEDDASGRILRLTCEEETVS